MSQYETFPKQIASYFTLSTMNATLSRLYPDDGVEARLYKGLMLTINKLMEVRLKRQDGLEMPIDVIGIDSGWMTRLVERVWLDVDDPRVVLTRGVGVKASDKPWSEHTVKQGDQIGEHWRYLAPRERGVIRKFEIDTNYWKSFIHARFATSLGDPGSFSLFRQPLQNHRLFADHMHAEYPVETEGRGRKVTEWKHKPAKPDNHWYDTMVGCAALASYLGISFAATKQQTRGRGRRRVAVLPRRD